MRSVESVGRLAVIIPAYKPSDAMVELVRALAPKTFAAIIVVDDGSGPEFRSVFDRVAAFREVTLLRHAVNLGKGAALKTGINHALCAIPDLAGVVTADADGQHHPDDIEKVAERSLADPGSLVLGCRTFHRDVPLRSRFGNILTSGVMHALMGRKLSDTQTGLRGIPTPFALRILKLEADGYEFEMEMLLAAHQLSIPLAEEPIRTIYEAGNPTSHFNPIVDSMRIYFVLLRFGSVSLLTAILDGLIFYLALRESGRILASQVVARIFSLTFNYSLVRRSVFYSHERHKTVLPKYLALVLASGTLSYVGIRLLSQVFGMNPFPAKVVAETFLFFVNFAVQRLLIFKPEGLSKPVPPTEAASKASGTVARDRKPWLAILVALVAVGALGWEARGFATVQLFKQDIWGGVGFSRFLRFTGYFVAFAMPLLVMVPWTFAAAVAALVAVGSAFSVGPLPPLAVAFFMISSCALGSRLLGTKDNDSPESQILATLAGIAAWVLLMTAVVRLPVNYPAVWAALLAIPILADLRGTWRRLSRWGTTLRLNERSEQAAFAILVFFLLAHWFAALIPEHSTDGLAMHLAIPLNIAANHRMTFEPTLYLWAVMPMAADFCYSIVALLGGEYATHLVDFAMLLLIEGLLYCTVRRWVSRATAFLLMALFATTPLVQFVTGSLYVENFQALMVLGMMAAIWHFSDAGERRYLYLAAALGGTALATKIGGLAFVAIGIPFAAREVARHWKSLGPKPAVVCLTAVALLLGLALPPYGIAFVKTGNPLFPFFGDKIVSPLLPADAGLVDDRFRHPLAWNTLFDLTFHSSRTYEGQNGSFGFQYLVLVPLAALAILFLRRRPATGAAVVGIGAGIVIMGTQPNARYLYACFPLVTITFGALLGWAAPRRWLYVGLVAFVLGAIGINSYFLPSAGYYNKEFSLRKPLSRADHELYLKENAPIRLVIDYYNRTHPDSTVLLAYETALAGVHDPVYENSWHQFSTFSAIRQARSAANMVQLMHKWKVEYVIAPKPDAPGYDVQPVAMKDMVARCTEREFEVGDQMLARVLSACKPPPPRPISVLSAGGYDDSDERIELEGAWSPDKQFAQPWGHTVTYCDEAGAFFRVTFNGTAIRYVYTAALNRGIAQVLIDGTERARMDMYSKDAGWQTVRRFGNLPAGVHTFEVRVTGEKNPKSSGTFVDLDAVVIE